MIGKGWFSLVVFCALLLIAPAGWGMAADSVLYAKPSASGAGNCSSWAKACTLEIALGQATAGDEIWVAKGTHKPTTGTDRSATFQLVSGVAVYGGYAGTETSREQRDWAANATILNGDIGTAGDDSDNSYHVVTGSSTDATALLDGFTVTAGHADGSAGAANNGGGMYNYSGGPTLTDLIFNGNSADRGGGMCNRDSSPTLTNVTFSGNSAEEYGGGMYNYRSRPMLTDVTFSGNSSRYIGGGMYNSSSSPALTNVAFSGNAADRSGVGGGMYNSSSSPTLTNVTFSANSAYRGGGMHNGANSSSTLGNCILWGNTPDEISNDNSTVPVTYSDVQGGYPGTGNIDADPLFVDADGADGVPGTPDDDLRLRSGSPAIDKGNNSYNSTATDLAGQPRIVDGNGDGDAVIDMGAYEAPQRTTQPSTIVVDKVTDPGGAPASFDFALTGGPDSVNRAFSLTDAAMPFNSGDLKPGAYAVAETVPAGWILATATCDDGSDPGAIGLDRGETVTCTFTNRQSEEQGFIFLPLVLRNVP